jgi:hypothetical protein
MIIVVKEPVPEPSVVLLFAIVGSVDVAQQTPLDVTSALPPFVISPPVDTVVWFISIASLVVRVGVVGFFLHEKANRNRHNNTITAIGVLKV